MLHGASRRCRSVERPKRPPARRSGPAAGAWVTLFACLAVSTWGQESENQPAKNPQPAEGQRRVLPPTLNFANALLNERRYELAADEYERFLKNARPGDDMADALYGLARSRLFLQQYSEAKRHLEEFLKLAPHHPSAATALFRLGEAAYLMRDLEASRQALERYVAEYPRHVHLDAAWPYLGDVRYGLGNLAGAREAYEKGLADHPSGPLADRSRYHLARVLAAQGETDRALAALDGLARGKGEWADRAGIQMGLIQLAAERHADALATFQRLEQTSPAGAAHNELVLRRAEALVGLKRGEEAEALLQPLAADESVAAAVSTQAGYALGSVRWDRGDAAGALSAWDKALGRGPSEALEPMLLFRSAEALAKLEQADEARARYVTLVENHPGDAWVDRALVRAAKLALDKRDLAEARRLARDAGSRFASSPVRADARLIEARAAQLAGENAAAIVLLQTLLRDDKPGDETAQVALYYLSQAHKAEGQEEKAAEILANLARTPGAALASSAQFSLGQSHFDAGRYADAVGPLDAFAKENPGDPLTPHALAYLVLAHHELGQIEAADSVLDRLAEGWPKSEDLVRVRLRLGEAALETKQHERARQLLSPVADRADSSWSVRACSSLGWALLGLDRPEEAARRFSSVVSSDPRGELAGEAAYMSGWSLEKAGQVDPALLAYQEAVGFYTGTPHAAKAALARARLLARSDRTKEAVPAYQAALRLREVGQAAPADVVLAELARVQIAAGELAAADETFRVLLAEHPESNLASDARLHLAESAYRGKNLDEARRLLEPLADEAARPKLDAEIWTNALYRLGRIELDQERLDEAVRLFEHVASSEGARALLKEQARFWQAESSFRAKRHADAEALFAAVVSSDGPESTASWRDTARLRRLQCMVELRRWTDVISEADRFLAERPEFPQLPEVQYARGRALASRPLPDFAGARAAFEAAASARPKSELAARSEFMIGETFLHEKKYREAARAFHQVELLSGIPRWQAAALLEAGTAYDAMNQPDEAASAYRKLVETFPEEPGAAEARNRLASRK